MLSACVCVQGKRDVHEVYKLAKRGTCGVEECNPDNGCISVSAFNFCKTCGVAFCHSMHCLNAHMNDNKGKKVKLNKDLTPNEDQGVPKEMPTRKRKGPV